MSLETQFAGDWEFLRLCKGAEEVDFFELMMEFARDAYPDVDAKAVWLDFCHMSTLCSRHLPDEFRRLSDECAAADQADAVLPWRPLEKLTAEEVRPVLESLCLGFRDRLGFIGDEENYYSPDNSYLNRVLARRKGIPISLAMLFREFASNCRLKLYGVSAPGHFVLVYPAEEPLYVDAFAGEVLTQPELRESLARRIGEPIIGNDVFRPASHLLIAARMLRNLKAIYAQGEQWDQALVVQRRLAALLPDFSDEQRDLGLMLVRIGKPWPALKILEPYVQQRPHEAESLQPFLRAARRMAAQWN